MLTGVSLAPQHEFFFRRKVHWNHCESRLVHGRRQSAAAAATTTVAGAVVAEVRRKARRRRQVGVSIGGVIATHSCGKQESSNAQDQPEV